MSGLPLNTQLTGLGATFHAASQTTADYRLFALERLTPPRPGLVRVGPQVGAAIDIEVWMLPTDRVGRFLQFVLPPLCIGHVALAEGGTVHGFLCEAHAVGDARDITAYGGWRQFLAQSAEPAM
jgi:allophanate hydrolase